MKIALFTAGQPRFTQSLAILQDQLKGYSEAHIYLVLWPSDDYKSSQDVIDKTSKLLLPNVTYKYIEIRKKEPNWFDDSKYPIRQNRKLIPSNLFKMWYGLNETFLKIPNEYDAYVRFRLDGRLSCDYDLKTHNLDQGLVMPRKPRYGYGLTPVNDQFAIANYDNMKKYCSIIHEIDRYYATSGFPFHQENYLSYHLTVDNKVNILDGAFTSVIKTDPGLI